MIFRRLAAALSLSLLALCSAGLRAQGTQAEYRLEPGDQIRILVYQNPDLTLETRVSEIGTITFPLVGVLQLGGKTVPNVEQVIAKALASGNFIESPQVTVLLLQRRGNQVSVLGQVNRPGRYPLEAARTRVSEMLAIAGGIGPGGGDTVIVTGMREGKPFRQEIDLSGLFLDEKLLIDPVILGDDVIYVHRMPMFYIYGEVQRPGSFRVERGMTFRQGLAQAGGPTGRGTERGLRVYRRNSGNIVEQKAPELDDLVRPDDVVYVRETIF